MKRSGKIVETKSGIIGITYDDQKPINGKIPVYVGTLFKTHPDIVGFKWPCEFKKSAMLVNPSNIKVIGFIN